MSPPRFPITTHQCSEMGRTMASLSLDVARANAACISPENSARADIKRGAAVLEAHMASAGYSEATIRENRDAYESNGLDWISRTIEVGQ